jgi:hypothetical protein
MPTVTEKKKLSYNVNPKPAFQAQASAVRDNELSTRPEFRQTRITLKRRNWYENRDNDSDNRIGIAVCGLEPDDGATTNRHANQGDAEYCASERKEAAARTGAEQIGRKT